MARIIPSAGLSAMSHGMIQTTEVKTHQDGNAMKLLKTVALIALLVASIVTQGVLAAEYTVTNLDTLGRSHNYTSGINESGQVVGNAYTTKAVSRASLSSGGTIPTCLLESSA
jgi:hypothetical protein